jgi:hypothetical protein
MKRHFAFSVPLLVSIAIAAGSMTVPATADSAGKAAHGGTCCKASDYNFEVSQKREKNDDVAFSVWVKDSSNKEISDGSVALEIQLDKDKKTEYVTTYNGKDGAYHALGVLPKKGQQYPITVNFSKKGDKTPSAKAEVTLKI